MTEKPKETGEQIVERWRKLGKWYSEQHCAPLRETEIAIEAHNVCADEIATFLEDLRELSAEFRGKVVNVKSGYWKDKPTEMTKKYKEIADTLDALLGERVTGGEK